MGFTHVESTINLQTDTLIVMSLMPGNYLEEVLVVEKKNAFSSAVGKHSLSLDWVKRMPAVLGEADVLKSLISFPV